MEAENVISPMNSTKSRNKRDSKNSFTYPPFLPLQKVSGQFTGCVQPRLKLLPRCFWLIEVGCGRMHVFRNAVEVVGYTGDRICHFRGSFGSSLGHLLKRLGYSLESIEHTIGIPSYGDSVFVQVSTVSELRQGIVYMSRNAGYMTGDLGGMRQDGAELAIQRVHLGQGVTKPPVCRLSDLSHLSQ